MDDRQTTVQMADGEESFLIKRFLCRNEICTDIFVIVNHMKYYTAGQGQKLALPASF